MGDIATLRYLQKRNLQLRNAGVISIYRSYVSFRPGTPDASLLADTFDSSFKAIRHSGQLESIVAQYGMPLWLEKHE
jgi:ABC-type amino acid transport substrate-binding protein